MNTGSLRLHSLVAVFILACSLFSRAQSDASGNDAGPTAAQQVIHTASTGARWDHHVAAAPTANASVANVKVSVDASKLRNIVGYRAFGIHTSVSDNNLISPLVVQLLQQPPSTPSVIPAALPPITTTGPVTRPRGGRPQSLPNTATMRRITISVTSRCCSTTYRTGPPLLR